MEINRTFALRSARVNSVDLHPSEPWVLSALDSGSVSVWNYKEKTLVKSLQVSLSSVNSAKFIPEKNLIVVDSDMIFIRAYNYSTWSRTKNIRAHSDRISCLILLPSHSHLVSASDDTKIKIWNSATDWSLMSTLDAHWDSITHMAFNPSDMNMFASASLDGTTKIWTVDSLFPILTIDAHKQGVNWVTFSFGGNKSYLITGSDDRTVKVWDFGTKNCVQEIGHTRSVSSVCFYPDPPVIITGSEDGEICMWNSRSFRLEKKLNYGLKDVSAVGCMATSRRVVVGYNEGIVIMELKHQFSIPSMNILGNIIWVKENKIHTLNVNTAASSFKAADGEILNFAVSNTLSNRVVCDLYPKVLKFNSDGQYVSLFDDGKYTIYNVSSWKQKVSGTALNFVWSARGEFTIRENAATKIFNKSYKEKKYSALNLQ